MSIEPFHDIMTVLLFFNVQFWDPLGSQEVHCRGKQSSSGNCKANPNGPHWLGRGVIIKVRAKAKIMHV